MTMTGDNTVSALRGRFGEALAARLPAHIGRLGWDARQLAGHQHDQLRSLLACALERSPFHARRLAGIDPGRFEPGQLAELPVMTKQQMMASFDELLTDHHVTRARAEQHLAACADEPGLLDGQYVCLASGGSSGVRGVFVQTAEEYAESRGVRPAAGHGAGIRGRPPAARRPAGHYRRGRLAGPFQWLRRRGRPRLPGADDRRSRDAPHGGDRAPGSNEAPQAVLLAHTSTLVVLAGEQHAGRMRISPRSVSAISELLTAEGRDAISAAFGVPPVSSFVSTEGLVVIPGPGMR